MRKFNKKMAPFVFLFPFLILSFLFTLIPMIYSLCISFMNFTFLNPSRSKFIGLSNYVEVFSDDMFLKSIGNNLIMIVVVVPILLSSSLLLAVLLNSKIKLRAFFRSAFYLPYVVSPVAMGVIAVQLFSKDNFIVKLLSALGLQEASWHTVSPNASLLIVLVVIWTQIGFYMVLYLNGLQSIPVDYYEAAELDGANHFHKFRYITVPQLRATTYLVLFMCFISTLQLFDQPYVISTTGGAAAGSPGDTTLTMVMYIYDRAFRYKEMGQASAAAFIVFLLIFAVSLLQNVFLGKEKE